MKIDLIYIEMILYNSLYVAPDSSSHHRKSLLWDSHKSSQSELTGLNL